MSKDSKICDFTDNAIAEKVGLAFHVVYSELKPTLETIPSDGAVESMKEIATKELLRREFQDRRRHDPHVRNSTTTNNLSVV